MRAWLAVGLLVVVACGDAADEVALTAPPSTPPPVTGPVEEWCAVVSEADPALPLFAGASINTADVQGTVEGIAGVYERLAVAPPGPIARDMQVVREGYVSFRDDLAVVGWEYEKVFAAIGQRPWQQREFVAAGERVAAFAVDECGVEVAAARPEVFGDQAHQLLVDALVETGLTDEQAGCLADQLGPDLGAGAGQPMAFEDAMAACRVTIEDFIPDQ